MQLEEATKIGRYLINGSGISDVDLYCYRHYRLSLCFSAVEGNTEYRRRVLLLRDV